MLFRSRRVVWHWYWIDGRYTISELLAKLLQLKAEFLMGERRAAAIAVSAEVTVDPRDTRAMLNGFLDELAPLAPILAGAQRRGDPGSARRADGDG